MAANMPIRDRARSRSGPVEKHTGQTQLDTLRRSLEVSALQAHAIACYRPKAATLGDRIVARVQTEVTRFATAKTPGTSDTVDAAVHSAIRLFVNLLAGAPTLRADVYDHFREFGRREAREGRNLDALLAANHIATQETWRELQTLTTESALPREEVAGLTDALIKFQSQLLDEAVTGFTLGRTGEERSTRARTRLLTTLLTGRDLDEVEALSQEVDWHIPERACVATVDVVPGADLGSVLAGTKRTLLSGIRSRRLTVVASAASVQNFARVAAERGLGPVSVSWPVSPDEIHHAHRWAQRVLDLTRDGVIAPPSDGLVQCADHQRSLRLHADPALREHLNQKLLEPLFKEKPAYRAALAETMLLWLRTRQSAPKMATQLGVHDQTVRHRLRRLKTLFGDELDDPDQTVSLLAALESSTTQWRGGNQSFPPTSTDKLTTD